MPNPPIDAARCVGMIRLTYRVPFVRAVTLVGHEPLHQRNDRQGDR